MAPSPGIPLPRFLRFLSLLSLALAVASPLVAQFSRDACVELTATTSATTPHITLHWPIPSGTPLAGNPPKLWRRAKGQSDWGTAITLTESTGSYADHSAQPGVVYEYSLYVWRATGNILRYGAIAAGYNTPLVEQRGNALLYVDNTQALALGGELATLERDLAADGWRVFRYDGARGVVSNGSASSSDHAARLAERVGMRTVVQSHYNAHPASDWALLILGRAPVAYSGDTAPDGHPEHRGAWPTDAYYADVDGVWTDTAVNTTSATSTRNDNIPGDGKFDQSTAPSNLELQTGRVDFAGMTDTPTGMTETELLRQYLVRNHRFRRGLVPYDNIARRVILADSFTDASHATSAYASAGWRAGVAFFGNQPGQADELPWLPTLQNSTALLAVGAGAGTYTSMADVGESAALASAPFKAVFTMSFGSYFGDWDVTNNFLRAPIAGTHASLGLASLWSGRGYVHLQHMALGESVGYSMRFTQNNPANLAGDWPQNSYHRSIAYNLMGDPTLRLHTVRPPSRVVAVSTPSGVALSWTASPDADSGHHVYRATSPAGPFVRLTGVAATASNPTGSPLTVSSFTDTTGVSGTEYTYLVKAVRMETSASGTYANQSLGESVTLAYVAEATPPPPVPTGLNSTASSSGGYVLAWQDNSSDETGFELQRRDPSTGVWSTVATLPADQTSHLDAAAPGAGYVHYRVRALGASAHSAWSATAADHTPPGLVSVSTRHVLVDKNAGSASLTLRRHNGDRGAVSVGYTSTSLLGSAADYAPPPDPVVYWPHGVSGEASHTVVPTAHATPQLTKLLRIDYASPTNGLAVGTPSSAFVQIQDATSQALPAGWSTTTLGNVSWAGYAEHVGGVFGISARTGNLTANTSSDNLRFVYLPVTGDCTLTARVVFNSTALNSSPRAGVMIRDSLAANARFKGILLNESVAAEIYRATTGGNSSSNTHSGAALPGWLRVSRVGDELRTYRSSNGTAWTEIGSARTITLGATAYVGLFLASNSSGSGGLPGYARFDNVSISAALLAPGNVSAAPGPQPGDIALSWDAVPAADRYLVERGSTAPDSGFAPVATVDGALAHLDSGLVPGTTYFYRIRAVATSSGSQSDWSAVASSAPYYPAGTLAAWRYAAFGTNSATGPAADDADPDGDGIPNLAEYARGLSPLVADPGAAAALVGRATVDGADHLTLTFDRDASVPDIDIVALAAGDLAGPWTAFDPRRPPHRLALLPDTPAPGRETITVRDLLPLSSGPRRFLRLRYQWKDSSLLARWRFDETGLAAPDTTTNYADLALRKSAAPADLHGAPGGGVSGQTWDRPLAANLLSSGNGVAVLLNPQSRASWQNLSELTLCGWIKMTVVPASMSRWIVDWHGAERIQLWWPWGAGQLQLSVGGTNFAKDAILTQEDVDNARWVFIAATYIASRNANGVKFYRGTVADSVALFSETGDTTTTGVITNTGAGNFNLGNTANADRINPGEIDDFRVYSRALSAAELELVRQSALSR